MPLSQGIGSYIDGHSPECGETDVEITAKGVQTCVDIWIPSGCYANITFYYLNWTTGWESYAYWEMATTTTTYCAWNDNVTCYIDGDIRTLFIWRVVAEYVCPQQNYSWTSYSLCNFRAEPCPLFYIHPDHNSTTVCPCCDSMCIGIENENGNNMNATIYGSYDGTNYFIWNKYYNISNGTYCFCMNDVYLERTPSKEGEWIGASGIQAPGAKPADLVQHGCSISWEFSDNQEEEIQFTTRIPQRMNFSLPITLDTGWSSPATNKLCNWNLSYSITALDEDTSEACEYYQDVLAWSSTTANGLTMYRYYLTEAVLGDKCFHFTIERDGNDPNDNLSDVANLHGICFSYYIDDDVIHIENATSPMRYNTTYYWYANITDVETGSYKVSNVFNFTTAENLSECPCGEEEIGSQVVLVKRDIFLFFLIMVVIILVLLAYKKEKNLK